MAARRQLPVAALAALALCAAPVRATQTDPALEIARATRATAATGALVQLDATFPMPDLVQRAIGVTVVVRDLGGGGTHWAGFPLGGAAVEGDAPSLADGLDPGDVAGLLASGTPLAGARVLHLGARRIELWLPAPFSPATAEVQLFIVYEGDPILSNPAPLEEGDR